VELTAEADWLVIQIKEELSMPTAWAARPANGAKLLQERNHLSQFAGSISEATEVNRRDGFLASAAHELSTVGSD
jgi:hypothetical protein